MIKLRRAVILIASRTPKTYASRALGCPPDKTPESSGPRPGLSPFAWAGFVRRRGCAPAAASGAVSPMTGSHSAASAPTLANATIAASRVSSYPSVGVWSSCCPVGRCSHPLAIPRRCLRPEDATDYVALQSAS
jgi:hypothetical protein